VFSEGPVLLDLASLDLALDGFTGLFVSNLFPEVTLVEAFDGVDGELFEFNDVLFLERACVEDGFRLFLLARDFPATLTFMLLFMFELLRSELFISLDFTSVIRRTFGSDSYNIKFPENMDNVIFRHNKGLAIILYCIVLRIF